MSRNPPPNQTIYRDSRTGRITTEKYAETHKASSERERVHNPALPPAPPPKRK